MLGDLLRLRGWEVSDFGVDVPSESLAHVIRQTPDLMAVGLSAMSSDNLTSLADACAALPVGDGTDCDDDGRTTAPGDAKVEAPRPGRWEQTLATKQAEHVLAG